MPSVFVFCNAIFNGLISLMATSANGLVIYTFFKTQSLHTINNIFLLQLAVADMIKAGVILPFKTYNQISDKQTMNPKLCLASGFITAMTTVLAVLLLAVIAIVRYYRVVKWRHFGRVFAKKRTALYSILIHLATFTLSILPLVGAGKYTYSKFHGVCFTDWSEINIPFRSLFYFYTVFFSFTTIIYCYTRIFLVLRKYMRDIREENVGKRVAFNNEVGPRPTYSQSRYGEESGANRSGIRLNDMKSMAATVADNQSNMSASSNRIHKLNDMSSQFTVHEIHVTKVMFAIVLAYACCWLPIFVITILKLSNIATPNENFVHFAISLVELKTFINPMMYGFMNHSFRSAIKAAVFKR